MTLDTRVITTIENAKAAATTAEQGDLKAATAAVDDARTDLYELLYEGPFIPKADWDRLLNDYDALNQALRLLGESHSWSVAHAVNIADRVVGSLTRIADRWNQ